VLAAVSKLKNGGSNAAAFADVDLRALAEHVAKKYESALRAANAVDFDDLILLTLRLFQEHPDALDACRGRWPFVMVDEYQDTNATQFALVQALTLESRNLCVVGDDDQSIYGWRGAEIANILDLEKHFPDVKIVKLEQNYRSTNTILKAANAVIGRNPRRRGKTLWSAKGQGSKIVLHAFIHDDAEAQTLVDNIEYDRIARRIPWGHQAVLFRTNLQARPIETALRKARMRYHLIGGQSFFDRREIRDFLAYVKTFVNPHDDVALLRIANTPARGLSDVTMERLIAVSGERHTSVFTVMRHTDVLNSFRSNTRDAIARFTEFIETTRAPLESGDRISLSGWAENWLRETGYLEDLRLSEKDKEAADNRVRNIKELIVTLDGLPEDKYQRTPAAPSATVVPAMISPSLATPPSGQTPSGALRYRGTPMERLDEFLSDLTLDQEREEDPEKAGDVVTLITMHAAKGLEFPHVHIIGVEDGLLPHSRSKVEGTMDEERRLFYVALTRAQETLRVSHCGARRRYGQLMPCHPSPFLNELPEDCVEHADAASAKPVAAASGADYFAAMRAALE
jgi:superfamily I DNA/RNA helicase